MPHHMLSMLGSARVLAAPRHGGEGADKPMCHRVGNGAGSPGRHGRRRHWQPRDWPRGAEGEACKDADRPLRHGKQ